MDQISWEDKELTVAGTWFFEVATHWTHTWAQQSVEEAKTGPKVKELFADLPRVKELSDEIYQNFLDDCFGNQSRVFRDKFIEIIQKECKYLFNAEELRQKVIAQAEN